MRRPYQRLRPRLPTPAGLTEREQQILRLIDAGLTIKQIAERLGVRVQTLKNHTVNAYEKLGINGLGGRRNEAVRRALSTWS